MSLILSWRQRRPRFSFSHGFRISDSRSLSTDGGAASRKDMGFTIVELMIATTILAVILLLLTVMMISIGRLYYKGLNQSRVQDSVRSIADDITQQLQLSGSAISTASAHYDNHGTSVTVSSYCIGTTRYSYIVGVQIGTGTDATTPPSPQIAHVLWKDTNTAGGCQPLDLTQSDPSVSAVPAGTSTNGSELVPANSRLTNFSVSTVGSVVPYVVTIEIAYGNADLLTGTTGAPGAVVCKGSLGDQYCATSFLTTTVVPRLVQ